MKKLYKTHYPHYVDGKLETLIRREMNTRGKRSYSTYKCLEVLKTAAAFALAFVFISLVIAFTGLN